VMEFRTVEQLQAQIASLTGEVERLRALVETAYWEGWTDDGRSWLRSESRAALQPKEGNP